MWLCLLQCIDCRSLFLIHLSYIHFVLRTLYSLTWSERQLWTAAFLPPSTGFYTHQQLLFNRHHSTFNHLEIQSQTQGWGKERAEMVKGSDGGQTISKRHVKPCSVLHTKFCFFWLMFWCKCNLYQIWQERRKVRWVLCCICITLVWPACFAHTFKFRICSYARENLSASNQLTIKIYNK